MKVPKKALPWCLLVTLTLGAIEGMARLAYRITCGEAYKESHFNTRGNELLAEQMLARIVGCGSSSLTVFPPVHRHFRPRTVPFLFIFARTELRTAPTRLFRAASPI